MTETGRIVRQAPLPNLRTRTDNASQSSRQREILVQIVAFFFVAAGWLSTLGPIGPVLTLAGGAGLIALGPQKALNSLGRSWPLLLVVTLPMLSALWSTAPEVSLRYGAQLGFTLIAAIVLAGSLPLEKLVRIFFLTSLAILALCIASGRQGGSVGGNVLIGILGSKNEMGTLCQLIISSGACVFFGKSESKFFKFLAGAGCLSATAVLLSSFATGALLLTIVFGLLCIFFIIGSRLSSGSRVLLVLISIVMIAPLVFIQDDLKKYWEYFLVDVLHKDVGLTGRDYLWAHADRLIRERPILGYGYRSTWLGQGSETIGLLRWANLSSGAGFHFHDTYREWAVDFGLVGAAVMCGCFGAGMARIVLRALSKGLTAPVLFFACNALICVMRAKVELAMGPFSSSAILLAATAAVGYQAIQHRSSRPVGRRAFQSRERATHKSAPIVNGASDLV